VDGRATEIKRPNVQIIGVCRQRACGALAWGVQAIRTRLHGDRDVAVTADGLTWRESGSSYGANFGAENRPISIEMTVVLRETFGLFTPCSGPTPESPSSHRGASSHAKSQELATVPTRANPVHGCRE
jgi:hypothetical protein